MKTTNPHGNVVMRKKQPCMQGSDPGILFSFSHTVVGSHNLRYTGGSEMLGHLPKLHRSQRIKIPRKSSPAPVHFFLPSLGRTVKLGKRQMWADGGCALECGAQWAVATAESTEAS